MGFGYKRSFLKPVKAEVKTAAKAVKKVLKGKKPSYTKVWQDKFERIHGMSYYEYRKTHKAGTLAKASAKAKKRAKKA